MINLFSSPISKKHYYIVGEPLLKTGENIINWDNFIITCDMYYKWDNH